MQNRFITYKNSSFHYCVYGKGAKLLFCFHGYGEQAESFAFLEEKLGNDYTLIAIDMPFHGQTNWQDGLNFLPQDLVEVIHKIQSTNQLFTQSTISLLGYSMGGRLALQLMQDIPSSIERVVLVAPDGLHKSFWYRFSTQNLIGNKLFRRAMYKPGRMFWGLKKAEQYKLLHQSIIRVAHYYLDDKEERIKLYQRWTTMRKFKPKLEVLKRIISQYNIPVRFLFGKYDNIILSERSGVFKDDTKNIQIHIAEAGHRLLQQKHADLIAGLFYQ